MRVFITLLTLYPYQEEDLRKKLNLEEVEKFWEGVKAAESFDKGIVFSNFEVEEIKAIVENFTRDEREAYKGIIALLRNLNCIKVNLTDYDLAYEKMREKLEDIFDAYAGKVDLEININLSCGHKAGALALYIAIMEMIYNKSYYRYLRRRVRTRIILRIYHAEKGTISPLPILNFENGRRRNWEKYLKYLKKPVKLSQLRKDLKKDGILGREGDKILMYLLRCGYIESMEDGLRLTEKGFTYLQLMEKLGKN